MFKFVSAIFLAGAAVLTDASKFKADHSLEKRSAESRRIKDKYPDRLPIIVERAQHSDIPDIDKMKYLVPRELTVGQFVYVIRKRIQLPPEKAIFIFVNNVLPPTASLLASVFEGSKDEDGFLYVSYSGENTFGGLEGLEELDDEDWEAMLSDFDGLRN